MRRILLAIFLLCCAGRNLSAAEGLFERLLLATRTSLQRDPGVLTHQCYPHTNAACGLSVTDTINIFGCATSSLNYFNAHRFYVSANTRLTVSVRSYDYAPAMILTDEAVTATLATGSGPIGTLVSMSYDVRTSGYYLVATGPLPGLVTGSYSIQISCSAIVAPPPPPTTNCAQNSTTLCLSNGRFAVSVNWRDFSNNTGTGNAVPMTADTGHFWFFNPANVELVIKVLDARTVNGKFWVFYGALSNVEYTITIRDTQTGQVKTYFNPSGTFASRGDVSAF